MTKSISIFVKRSTASNFIIIKVKVLSEFSVISYNWDLSDRNKFIISIARSKNQSIGQICTISLLMHTLFEKSLFYSVVEEQKTLAESKKYLSRKDYDIPFSYG